MREKGKKKICKSYYKKKIINYWKKKFITFTFKYKKLDFLGNFYIIIYLHVLSVLVNFIIIYFFSISVQVILFLGWFCSSMAVLNKIDIGLDQKLSVPEVISSTYNFFCLVSYL